MNIENFIWLPAIVDKIETKHGVSAEEAEEVFFNQPKFRFVESGHRKGENVYSASGQTDAGRYLIVFFVYKSPATALVLSARDMDAKEKRRYERK
jgi:uncharacterized DUF497 family protein